MNKLLEAVTRDRVTTCVGLLCITSLIVLGVYTKQLNVATVTNFIFTALVGFTASDGGAQK